MKDEVVIGGSLEQLNSNYGDADLTLRISGDPSLDLISGEIPIPTGMVAIGVGDRLYTKDRTELVATDNVVSVDQNGDFLVIPFSEVTASTPLWAVQTNGRFSVSTWEEIVKADPYSLQGEPSLSLEVDGDADLADLVDGEGVPIFGIAPNPYTGEYTITPTTETQTLATANKTLTRDIVINPIPSNYGLITWNGSTLMVS